MCRKSLWRGGVRSRVAQFGGGGVKERHGYRGGGFFTEPMCPAEFSGPVCHVSSGPRRANQLPRLSS